MSRVYRRRRPRVDPDSFIALGLLVARCRPDAMVCLIRALGALLPARILVKCSSVAEAHGRASHGPLEVATRASSDPDT
jgi:hypothetical protein